LKFLILGDSWALGEFRSVKNRVELQPCAGLAHWLPDSEIIAKAGAGNYGQLRHARTVLEQGAEPDWIVWFSGEPTRDIIETYLDDPLDSIRQYPSMPDSFNDAMQYIHLRNYEFADRIYQKYGQPWIVIGGSAPLSDAVDQFDFAHFTIKNWCREILNCDYPQPWNFLNYSNSERALEVFRRNSPEEVITEIDRSRYLTLLTQAHPDFLDGYHPNDRHHQALAQRILNYVGQA